MSSALLDSKILKRNKMREKRKKQFLKKEEERMRKFEYNSKNNLLRPSTKILSVNSQENSLKTRLHENSVGVNSEIITTQREGEDSVTKDDFYSNGNIISEVLIEPGTSDFSDTLNQSENFINSNSCNAPLSSNQPATTLSDPQEKKLRQSSNSDTSFLNQFDTSKSNSSNGKDKRYIRTLLARQQKLYRRIRQLEATVGEKNKIIHKWTVRCSRMQKIINDKSNSKNKVLNAVKTIERQGPAAVRNRLLYCEVLDQQLQHRKSTITNEENRIVFEKMLSGPVVKENKSMEKLAHLVSLRSQRKYMDSELLNGKRSCIKADQRRSEISQVIKTFFESEENSSIAPGVKDTITLHNVKKRKRYLCDTGNNLFTKFKKQYPLIKVSRAVFYKYKPFWIVHRPVNGRDTCLCKTHSNMQFVLLRLSHHKLLNYFSLQSFAESRVCNDFNKECWYKKCKNCENKQLDFKNSNDRTWYFKWETRSVNRLGAKEKMYEVKITSKVRIDSTVDGLITEANNLVDNYLRHEYLRVHQHRTISIIRDCLKPNEAFYTGDFSQNWICKYAAEIQSAHFGASKKQLSLHTGAFYYRNAKGELKCISCCTVSECLRHDAAAVWTHLQPILKLMQETLPELSAIHIQTDGPSSQYRNKTCFHLFQQFCVKMGLNHATWNFTAPGHGKSVADGTGGTVKGICDRKVAQGKDIVTAEEMINEIHSSTKVKAFLISEDDFKIIDKMTNCQIVAAPGTTKIYQLIWLKKNQIGLLLNELSCSYCYVMGLYESPCRHFALSPHTWIPAEKTVTHKKRTAQSAIGSLKNKKSGTKTHYENPITPKVNTKSKKNKSAISKHVYNTRQRKR